MVGQANILQVSIANFPETRVAVFEYRGSIESLDQSIATYFIPWRTPMRICLKTAHFIMWFI